MKYAFIQAHASSYPVRRLCKVMAVHPSGYYAWQHSPESARTIEDKRLLGHIKQSWLESGAVYGYRKVCDDLLELGETCGKHRIYRLMRQEKLRSQTGYHRRPKTRGGMASVFAPNHLNRQFDVAAPNQVWVTDITYIRTHEGWLFLVRCLTSSLVKSSVGQWTLVWDGIWP